MDRLRGGRGLSTRKDTCPNCKRATALERDSRSVIWTDERPSRTVERALAGRSEDAPGSRVELEVWRCMFCNRTTTILLVYAEDEQQESKLEEVRQVWPEAPPRELPEEAPDDVRSLYREASIVENAGALRGAAVLYRGVVEHLVSDQGTSGSNLKERIDGLKGKGLDDDLVEDLHDARLTGNWSIHQGTTFSAEEVADVARLIADAVQLLYVQTRGAQSAAEGEEGSTGAAERLGLSLGCPYASMMAQRLIVGMVESLRRPVGMVRGGSPGPPRPPGRALLRSWGPPPGPPARTARGRGPDLRKQGRCQQQVSRIEGGVYPWWSGREPPPADAWRSG
jgi:ribosomal protein L37AE/L43A